MSINTLEFATRFTGELDKALVQKAVTGIFADNNLKAKFVGANTVKIPSVVLSGAGNYDRDNGFTQGSITVSNQALTLSMDRARTFMLDREDYDETGIAELAGSIMGEFVRTKMAPEVDAYTLSHLYGVANTNSHVVEYADAYSTFVSLYTSICGATGFDNNEMVCFVNPSVWAEFMTTDKISRQIVSQDFKKGDVNLTVKTLNDVPILPVNDACMKSSYKFNDGKTNSGGDNQTGGGFTPASAANDIKMIILPKKACSLVKKTEKIRTFAPDVNQKADAYKFDYRLYYDAFTLNSYKDTIYAAKPGS